METSLSGRRKGGGHNARDAVARGCPQIAIWAMAHDFPRQNSVLDKKRRKEDQLPASDVGSVCRSQSRYDRLEEGKKNK
jgi:hypothetical protein